MKGSGGFSEHLPYWSRTKSHRGVGITHGIGPPPPCALVSSLLIAFSVPCYYTHIFYCSLSCNMLLAGKSDDQDYFHLLQTCLWCLLQATEDKCMNKKYYNTALRGTYMESLAFHLRKHNLVWKRSTWFMGKYNDLE